MSIYTELNEALLPHGFILRGGFHLEDSDLDCLGVKTGTLIMIGNAGTAFWRHFDDEKSKGTNPMDDWSRETLTGFANIFGASPLFPFDGPPYYPFQQWAQRCEPVYPSPVGPLIHPKFGLWHAYRSAFLFDQEFEVPSTEATQSPCETCSEKPCLKGCPAGVFNKGAYDVPTCIGFLKTNAGQDCIALGCAARRACPIGQKFTYTPEHARFHMEKFVKSNG